MITANNIGRQTTDCEIRKSLRHYLADDAVRVIEEFNVENGASRADLVGISDAELHGYEIKSDVDSLGRLASQVQSYNKVFSRVTVVVGIKHVRQVAYMIPDWWGIILAKYDSDGHIIFSKIRQAGTNPNLDAASLLRLLLKQEIGAIVKRHDLRASSHSTKESLTQILRDQIDDADIRIMVAASLRLRYCS